MVHLVMLGTMMWKHHIIIVVVCGSLSPSSTVGNGCFKHHSKNSTPEVGLISPERDLHARCICE